MFEDEKKFENEIKFDQLDHNARVKIIGVGGGGCNAVNRMIEENIQGVEFWVANTDAQVLVNSKTTNRIILGHELTKGLGAGANPEIGKEATIESEEKIKAALKNADMVFVAAGMGGGTGTGAAPIIAKIAKDLGCLTVAIVTKPFTFEGSKRNENALLGLDDLKQNVDSLIVVSNDKLLQVIGNIPLNKAFDEADKVLRQGVQTITDLIALPAMVNLDFADVKNVMSKKGYALIGIGSGKGENKAEKAAKKAISSPLLEASIRGAKDAIVNVTGGESMTLMDANESVDIIKSAAESSDVNIIFGIAVNENLSDEMIVTVIATGFDESSIEAADLSLINQKREQRRQEINSRNSYKNNQDTKSTTLRNVFCTDTTRLKRQEILQKAQLQNVNDEIDDDIPSFLRRH